MSLLNSLIEPVTGLLDKVIADKDERARLAHEISTMAERMAHENAQAQLDVNKQEAAHQSLFVSGWRPAIAWCCCLSMVGNYLVIPGANFILAFLNEPVHIELIDMSMMMPVLLGILGLGSMRSVEKLKGVARQQ